MIALSQINGKLVRSVSPTKILRFALFATAIISLLLIFTGIFNAGFWSILVLIFLYIASLGMIFPNATAGALSEQTENAGSASALIGTLQYGLAAISSSFISHFNNGTAIPMISIICVCGITAFFILNLLLTREKKIAFAVSEEHITFG